MSWDKLGGLMARKFGMPQARALVLGTVYRAIDITRPAIVSVNLTSTATLTLTGNAAPEAEIVVGATDQLLTAGGGGISVSQYKNALTGGLVVGINLSLAQTQQLFAFLPIGWYFAIRQKVAPVSIVSAFDQAVG